jgi:small-conductance mechanosensitive channel/CRP-like cAMP-binding protein
VTNYTPLILEITGLILVWLLATGFTAPLRRRLQREGTGRQSVGTTLLDLLAHVSRALMVLVFTQLVTLLLHSWPAGWAWFSARPEHLSGWRIFWLGVGAICLIEGLALAFFRRRGQPFPIPDLLLDIIRALLVVAVGIVVLNVELGIDIGPLLASTALLTAVAGFALQGVLGNLMAGMSLHLVRTLRPGIWVEVDGVTGRITKTNWRETRIRTRGGHMYIIPNARIAENKIHNFNEPSPLRRHEINVGASYSDAPDDVIAAMLDAVRTVPEVRRAPSPEAMITEFQDYGINYRLYYWTTELHRDTVISGHVNRNIWYQFKRRGIEIPFPMSDKLLNDFMTVVYNQRKLMPLTEDVERTVKDLQDSDLCSKVLVDAEGQSLLSAEDLNTVAPLVKRQPYTRGELLCGQGEAGESFWVVARGQLKGEILQDGKVAASFAIASGSVVGEMSPLTGVPRSATITVTESAELLEFGPEAFKALLALHEDLPQSLSQLAARRADQNRAALEALALQLGEGAEVQFEQKGILKRLLRIVGR